MWPCQQPSAAWPGFLGRRLCCAPYGGACAGSPGPHSPRSADGPVIIISRLVLPDHFLAPWTAVSLASLRRDLKSHFSSVLYFVHSINLYCDPAPGLHPPVSRLGQELPRGLFFTFFFPATFISSKVFTRPSKKIKAVFILTWQPKVSHDSTDTDRRPKHFRRHPRLNCRVMKTIRNNPHLTISHQNLKLTLRLKINVYSFSK